MDQQHHAAAQQYRNLTDRLATMIEQFYIFSNDMEVQITNILAISDDTPLQGRSLTEDFNTIKRDLNAMKMGSIVNLDFHLMSLTKRMDSAQSVNRVGGSSYDIPFGTIHQTNEEPLTPYQQGSGLQQLAGNLENLTYSQKQSISLHDDASKTQRNELLLYHPEHRSFEADSIEYQFNEAIPPPQQSLTPDAMSEQYSNISADRQSGPMRRNDYTPLSQDAPKPTLSGDQHSRALPYVHQSSMQDHGIASHTTQHANNGYSNAHTVPQPHNVQRRAQSAMGKTDNARQKRAGRLGVPQTRYSLDEDKLIGQGVRSSHQRGEKEQLWPRQERDRATHRDYVGADARRPHCVIPGSSHSVLAHGDKVQGCVSASTALESTDYEHVE